MNFSSVSVSGVLGKLLRLPLRCMPQGTIVPIMQGRLRGRKWIIGAGTHGCWLGSYEWEKRLLFERVITRGSVVFDIGAHAGFYTLLSSILVGEAGHVFAFEPVQRNIDFLHRHLKINGVQNVIVIEAAVSERSGTATFAIDPDTYHMGHLSPDGAVSVPTVSIDELTATGTIPLPNFIKMDIEGAEVLALKGARQTIAKSRPTLFLATHDDSLEQKCLQFLRSLGYTCQRISDTAACNGEWLAQPAARP